MSTKESIEELRDEIRKLRGDVKELREASQWNGIRYVPQPYFVPYFQQPYYVQPWQYGTVTWTNMPVNTATSYTITNNAGITAAYQLTNGTATTTD